MLKVHKGVSPTLGPKGRTALLEYEKGWPKLTKDGVTVGKNIMLEDRGEEIGARLLRNIAGNINQLAGDGTTTTIVLTTSIVQYCLTKLDDYKQIDLNDLRKGLLNSSRYIVEYLEEIKKEVETRHQLHSVAMVASNHDPLLAELVAEVIQ